VRVALGRIADPVSIPALRAALDARDPHLARIAFEVLGRIERAAPRGAP
jgi:hypothetical protein